jgi:hypothetical protein
LSISVGEEKNGFFSLESIVIIPTVKNCAFLLPKKAQFLTECGIAQSMPNFQQLAALYGGIVGGVWLDNLELIRKCKANYFDLITTPEPACCIITVQ